MDSDAQQAVFRIDKIKALIKMYPDSFPSDFKGVYLPWLLSMATRTHDTEQKLAQAEGQMLLMADLLATQLIKEVRAVKSEYEDKLTEAQKQAQEATTRAERAETELERLKRHGKPATLENVRTQALAGLTETANRFSEAVKSGAIGKAKWTGKTTPFIHPLPPGCTCQYIKDGSLCIASDCPVHWV